MLHLMVLNLMPILPLDGGRIVVSLLPHALAMITRDSSRTVSWWSFCCLTTGYSRQPHGTLHQWRLSLVEALIGV